MTQEDLMLGDWVYNALFVDNEGKGHGWKPVKVCKIPFDKEEYIEPIPITPEILEKNGFEKGGETYFFSTDFYDLQVEEYSDGNWLVVLEDCEFNLPHSQVIVSHVHQLQHALRLCGIKKDIME